MLRTNCSQSGNGVIFKSPAPCSLPLTTPSLPPMAVPCSPPVRDLLPSLVSAPVPPPAPQPSPPVISTLEKLIKTCPVWLQLGMSQERASFILQRESPGIFIVRKNIALKRMILSVRLSDQEGAPQVTEMLIKEDKSLICLEGSVLVFDNIFKLIAFYTVSRDILPFTLRLPQVVVQATKYEDMDIISSLGSDFWGSSLNASTECDQDTHKIDPTARSAKLWYVNPILMEEYCNGLPGTPTLPKSRSQSLTMPSLSLPNPPWTQPPGNPPMGSKQAVDGRTPAQTGSGRPNEEGNGGRATDQQRSSDRAGRGELAAGKGKGALPVTEATCGKNAPRAGKPLDGGLAAAQVSRKTAPPVPPRRKRASRAAPALSPLEVRHPGGADANAASRPPPSASPTPACRPAPALAPTSAEDLKGSNGSLQSTEGRATPLLEGSEEEAELTSAEEEAELPGITMAAMKRSSTIMLDKAKQRFSMVSLPHVFTRFMKAERKLQNHIVELARDRDSYFGNLVRDYQTFTLETMPTHASSTEMLQEIRQMLTQLKSYLIQSSELRTLPESALHTEEKLETIVELALYKGVLKPIRQAVYSCLRDVHTRDDSLKRLRENQQVVLNTTTTDLGITTSVPEAPVMEKIQVKLDALHRHYSPENKISHLLKTCKLIYESMSVGSPGRPHGVDDFLPVLMYVLVRCNIAALLLDVEYMMELMDPALQLGEGSYYLTTAYGALEHIKSYDRQPPTGQLSLDIQDSIHRWERRRTHNMTRLSRSSVQDFINVSFLDASAKPRTLCVCSNTTAQDLSEQCAGKFEVTDPGAYGLWVLVEGEGRLLAPDELLLSVKSALHYAEPRREYRFIYQPGTGRSRPTPRSQRPLAPRGGLI
ncbi:hypothetical protein AAFF_G00012190 [Aldrovandia affinis]|uniref:Ras and Rab interactor 3 n=1 Tax=Aldrovandia affinis TaxID=143900 RepID=A0AAD7WH51_9TELE|nr:hypothetical protein AAFF_G00012190 [Aldrovandia affinis]